MTFTLRIQVADQPGGGGGGTDPDPPGPGGSGTTVTETAVWQGITFTLSENCTVGYLASGMPFFVSPGTPVTVTWSPDTTTAGGLVVNGAMKNPDRDFFQGWDAREGDYSNAVRQTSPASMSAGDSLVVQTHNQNPTTAGGGTSSHPVYSMAYASLICLAATPAAHSYIPAVGPYSAGGGARPVTVFDVSTITFPSYTISSGVDSMANVLARLAHYNPVGSQVRGVEPRRKLTPSGFTPFDGYGLQVAAVMADAGVRLIGNDSTADKRALAKMIMMHFVEWYPAVKAYAGAKWTADGGQNQGLILPVILGLGWTGDTAGLAALMTDLGSNELTQAFRVDATLLGKIRNPHNNVGTDWPQTTLRRTVSSVAGNVLSFTDAASWQNVFIGTLLVRESDGATARVVAYNASLKTMTIAAQPGVPFGVGNVCFNRAPYDQADGDAEWILKGVSKLNYYTPATSAAYRNLNRWDGLLMSAQAFGFVHSNWTHFRDYVVRANAGVNPPAPDTYPNHFNSAGIEAFWNTHWPAISAVPQTVG